MYCSAPSVPVSAKLSLDLNMSQLYGGGMNHFSLCPSIPVVVRIATAENFAQDKIVFFFSCLSFYSSFYTSRTPTAFIYIYF